MPKLLKATPKYCKHRASGQAIVRIDGRKYYLGPHGSKTSLAEYDRLVAEWLANGRRMPSEQDEQEAVTVLEIIAAYLKHAKVYYRKDGKVTNEYTQVKESLAFVKRLYGRILAKDFGPKRLAAVREAMIQDRDYSRKHCNKQVSRIKRMFRWAASEELVSGSVYESLRCLPDLKQGRTQARETSPVMPVDESTVQATLAYLPEVVADMVRFQRLTGMRPGEICMVRPCDLDRSGDVWWYRPQSHKTQHHGRERVVCIGPKAQEILRPYLLRAADAPCFSPSESLAKQRAARHEQRKTPLSCGNKPGSNRKANPCWSAGDAYTKDSYRRAVHRGVEAANRERAKAGQDPIEKWSPNRLRHSAATEIRRQFGLEAAQVCLGHAAADITQVYAERDMQKAAEVMRALG